MAFDSFQAFMFMEGHGPYVWTCYLVFFVLMTGLVVWSLRQRSSQLTRQRREQQRSGAPRQSQSNFSGTHSSS